MANRNWAQHGLHVYDTNNTIDFYGNGLTPLNLLWDAPSLLDEWRHLCATFRSGEAKLYFDGQLVASNSATGTFVRDSFHACYIGDCEQYTYGGLQPLNGLIDEVVVFDRVLSDCGVAMLAEDLNSNGIADFWEIETTETQFSGAICSVPHDSAILLEWDEAINPFLSITYNIYYSTTPGGQDFNLPDASTQSSSYLLDGLINGITYYIVVRAEDSDFNETTNTNEILCIPGANIISDVIYNHDFEGGFADMGTRGPIVGKPAGWSASHQEYGGKISFFQVDDTDPYAGNYCVLMATIGTPPNENDLSIASLISDNHIPLFTAVRLK